MLSCNNYWVGDDRPCLTYGTRGVIQMKVTIDGPGIDTHSGKMASPSFIKAQFPLSLYIFYIKKIKEKSKSKIEIIVDHSKYWLYRCKWRSRS